MGGNSQPCECTVFPRGEVPKCRCSALSKHICAAASRRRAYCPLRGTLGWEGSRDVALKRSNSTKTSYKSCQEQPAELYAEVRGAAKPWVSEINKAPQRCPP